ncbi:8456_t:CDS:1, partial [Entrophospora sp. SA101]
SNKFKTISSTEISELQNSIDALNLKDPITAECFICNDDKAPTQEPTDEEIIRAVDSSPEVDDSDEEEEVEMMVISDKEANNFTISYQELKMINGLKSKIHKHIRIMQNNLH